MDDIETKQMEAPANKMQTADTTKQLYFYPDHGVTVEASSQEEAEIELAKIIEGVIIKPI